MPDCPCCCNKLMRHACNNRIYWFCRFCWQEMPDFSTQVLKSAAVAGTIQATPQHWAFKKRLKTVFNLAFNRCEEIQTIALLDRMREIFKPETLAGQERTVLHQVRHRDRAVPNIIGGKLVKLQRSII